MGKLTIVVKTNFVGVTSKFSAGTSINLIQKTVTSARLPKSSILSGN